MDFNKTPYSIAFCEFIAMFFLVFALNLNASNPIEEINFAAPLLIVLIFYIIGFISNLMFNGTILFLDFLVTYTSATKPYNIKKPALITFMHITGAYLAMTLAYICLPTYAATIKAPAASSITIGPVIKAGESYWTAGALEGFHVFILSFLPLLVWDKHFVPVHRFFVGFVYGCIVLNATISIGDLTGASLNPTLWFAIKSFNFFVNGNWSDFSQILPYFIGQFTGCLLAFVCYKFFLEKGLKQIFYKHEDRAVLIQSQVKQSYIQQDSMPDVFSPVILDNEEAKNYKRFVEEDDQTDLSSSQNYVKL